MADMLERLQEALGSRYRIERELGRGGMATVYLAEDVKHHRQVALKVLDPEVAAAIGPERFTREIRVTAGFDHPHILPLLDSGEVGGLAFYSMPHVEGGSLRDRLARLGALPVDEAVRLALEVAEALSYAHARGIIHRDIKPENILLSQGHARVADFGLAGVVAASGSQRLTETGVTLGTPLYMSPEQITAESVIDGRSDIYSLGCVLYEMLAGHPPFAGASAHAVLGRKLHDSPPPLRSVRASVPEGVEHVVRTALSAVAADRLATADEFARTLRGAMMTGPTPLGRASKAPAWSPGRRWRWVAVVGLVLVAVAALAVRVATRQASSPPASAPSDSAGSLAGEPFLRVIESDPPAGSLLLRSALRRGVPVRVVVEYGWATDPDTSHKVVAWLSALTAKRPGSDGAWIQLDIHEVPWENTKGALVGTLTDSMVIANRITLRAWIATRSFRADSIQQFSVSSANIARLEYPVQGK
jgi:serine/threonine-protein kinase